MLKPGGHLLAFGGTRTSHRMAVAIEDAGFEIRDSIVWLYGSGFPKSLDVSKAIDKAAGAEREVVGKSARHVSGKPEQRTEGLTGTSTFAETIGMGALLTAPATDDAKRWDGWGTALKPAHEPVIVARKPLAKGATVASNVLAYGTGALHIDACRVEGEPWKAHRTTGLGSVKFFTEGETPIIDKTPHDAGRWPANVTLDEYAAAQLDEQSGILAGRGNKRPTIARKDFGIYGAYTGVMVDHGSREDGGASRFFPVFRYQAKAPTKERPKVNGVAHSTVKPLELMRWLVRLVTPPDGIVLDPFAGSGTTAEACVLEGMRCLTIERESDYLPLIEERMTRVGLVDSRTQHTDITP